MILKEAPEDFLVTERMPICWGAKGRYSYYLLSKRDHTTTNAVRLLARATQRNEKDIGIAGNKDRVAITQQVVSVRQGPCHDLHIAPDVSAKFIGRADRPVSLGTHDGNEFIITARNLSEEECTSLKTPNPVFLNLFGDQRFSTDNVTIGRAILKKDFNTAATIAAKTHDSVAASLQKRQTDFLGAIRTLPLRLLKIFVHSYQSHLWNNAATEEIGSWPSTTTDSFVRPQITMYLPGFATPASPTIAKYLQADGIAPQDFVIRAIPEISAEGGERAVYSTAQDLQIEISPDEKHPGKNKATISFFLEKGCYATVFVKHLFTINKPSV